MMTWKNLQKNKCPQCNKDITAAYNPKTRLFECKCGFRISIQKFQQIVNSRVTQDIEDKLNKEYADVQNT